MKQLLIVFFGGGLGSVLRYVVSKFYNPPIATGFPTGTFLVNALGCFFIGLCLGYFSKNVGSSQTLALLLATGFCGGMTTFSSFMYESHELMKLNAFFLAVTYMIASLVVGLLMVYMGLQICRNFIA